MQLQTTKIQARILKIVRASTHSKSKRDNVCALAAHAHVHITYSDQINLLTEEVFGF
jgi:hypothetical protein